MNYIGSKIGCKLIGWDADILASCGEASKRQFRKLLSALLIMMIIWGTIGFCFAQNYLDISSLPGKIGIAIVFMAIILSIERIIILSVGRNWLMATMRTFLAICMAILGASIFDQLIFRNDIQHEVASRRSELIHEEVTRRLAIYELDIKRISNAADSISRFNDELYKQIEANPTTTVTAVSTSEVVVGTSEDGTPRKTKTQSVDRSIIPNPRIAQAKGNEEQLKIYSEQLDNLRKEKKDIDNTVRDEINSRPTGFIEELEATLRVISNSTISLVFYAVLFLFLLFLELFVLSIKMGEKPCDYEMIVEHQLSHKETLLNKTELNLSKS